MSDTRPRWIPAGLYDPLATLLGMRPLRNALAVLGVVIAATIGLAIAWQKWGTSGLGSEEFWVTPAKVEISAQPAWLHTDVKAEVAHTANWQKLSLQDATLTEQISRAFAGHPWVARVYKVEKQYPAKVLVDLEYRAPVAVVEVVKGDGRAGLVFVDRDATVLPAHDLVESSKTAAAESEDRGLADQKLAEIAKSYLRISVGELSAKGLTYGEAWDKPSVKAGAKLAHLLRDDWKSLQIHRIDLAENTNGQWICALETKDGKRVLWGKTVGEENENEPAAAEKLKRLQSLVSERGPLSGWPDEPVVSLQSER